MLFLRKDEDRRVMQCKRFKETERGKQGFFLFAKVNQSQGKTLEFLHSSRLHSSKLWSWSQKDQKLFECSFVCFSFILCMFWEFICGFTHHYLEIKIFLFVSRCCSNVFKGGCIFQNNLCFCFPSNSGEQKENFHWNRDLCLFLCWTLTFLVIIFTLGDMTRGSKETRSHNLCHSLSSSFCEGNSQRTCKLFSSMTKSVSGNQRDRFSSKAGCRRQFLTNCQKYRF